MTEPQKPDDAHWLSALAGRPESHADVRVNREAATLRAALKAQQAALDRETPVADDLLLRRILNAANQLDGAAPPYSPDAAPENRPTRWNPPAWATAAAMILGIALLISSPISFREKPYQDVVRGGGVAATLVVDDPQARLEDILRALPDRPPPTWVVDARGRIQMELPWSDDTINFLIEQRIPPPPEGRPIVIVIEKTLTP